VTESGAGATRQSTASQTVNVLLILGVLAGGAMLARRNILLGRVDSRGAVRIAAAMVILDMVAWLLRADHAFGAGNEFELFVLAVGGALFNGAFVWLLYMALEPEVRRHWPKRLISWERLLTRGGRDPLVGRDVLVGLTIGLGMTTMLSFVGWLMWTFFEPHSETLASGVGLMSSPRHAIGVVVEHLSQAVFAGLFITVLVLLARLVLRRTWAAVVLASLIFVGLNALQNDPWYVSAILSALLLAGVMYCLLQFGLLSLVVTIFTLNMFQAVPLIFAPGSWQGTIALFPVIAVILLACTAFARSLGKQNWFPVQ
jgi:serine/threonine-protein kinase